MIYVDSSCLVKLIHPEAETAAVLKSVSEESAAIISTLADLEAMIQLKAFYKAGQLRLSEWRKFEARLYQLRNEDPFQYKSIPPGIWNVAFRQHRGSGDVHCRTLDRLHLSAMELLGVTRIMTYDNSQAAAARELGFEVIQPGK
jgi:predicted nucleic acid-binding protein